MRWRFSFHFAICCLENSGEYKLEYRGREKCSLPLLASFRREDDMYMLVTAAHCCFRHPVHHTLLLFVHTSVCMQEALKTRSWRRDGGGEFFLVLFVLFFFFPDWKLWCQQEVAVCRQHVTGKSKMITCTQSKSRFRQLKMWSIAPCGAKVIKPVIW